MLQQEYDSWLLEVRGFCLHRCETIFGQDKEQGDTIPSGIGVGSVVGGEGSSICRSGCGW